MCGLAGILHFGAQPDAPARVKQMADSIVHRGPDGEGFWSNASVALGFRRLAIVDLETGHQPMPNEDGSIQVVFNGEIYNHVALRRELVAAGHQFTTDHSDTEVLVHGYEQWGLDLLPRLNGMFAFALWDGRAGKLLLARDRIGIKPLYIAEAGATVVFASEIRALHASGLVAKKPNAAGVLEYFQQQSTWQGRSMFAGLRQINAGTCLIAEPGRTSTHRFWGFNFQRRTDVSLARAAADVRSAVGAAIERQIAADVPVMTYLSGGIDSSSITARAHQIDPNVRAYSCIFNLDGVGEDKFVDEREFSRAIAKDIGIDHVEMELPQDTLIGALRPTLAALEEPMMGMAYVNHAIAGRVARDSKVVLSGCGGDEITGGYVGRYKYVADQVKTDAPRPNTSFVSRFLGRPHAQAGATDIRTPMRALYGFPVAEADLEKAFTTRFLRDAGHYRMRDSVDELLAACPSDDTFDKLMYVDASTYLHGLLVLEDKLSMTHSLETRVPLLDNEMIDVTTTLPWSVLTDCVTGKIAFREAIRDWVPAIVADKPKMGFGPPDASWYRGALQPFIRRTLAPARIAVREVFNPAYVAEAIEEHMSAKANRLPLIWSLLSFDAWCVTTGFYGGDLDRA